MNMENTYTQYATIGPRTRSGGVIYEHTLKAEKAIGRPLPPKAEVHHVDGDGYNNANTNLVICQDHAYHWLLHARARTLRAGGDPNTQQLCEGCNTVKDLLTGFKKNASNKVNSRNWTCRECMSRQHALKRAV